MSVFDTPQKDPVKVITDDGRIIVARELIIGAGTRIFKVNIDGAFFGGEDFASAPIQISFDGVIKLGSNNLILDGPNQRIVLNDGTTNRLVIGNL